MSYSQVLLDQIKQHTREEATAYGEQYHGTAHHYYGVSNPIKHQIAKEFHITHKDLSFDEFLKLLDELYHGESYEEKTITGSLLTRYPKFAQKIAQGELLLLDEWLSQLEGWAEVDSTCQSIFKAEDILSNWQEWQPFLVALAHDPNMNKRRASLVFLTMPVQKSADPRLSDQAFANIEILKSEKPILITKAISWLLRSLVTNHKHQVAEYIEQEKNSLPKIAIRETLIKIRTGKKNYHSISGEKTS